LPSHDKSCQEDLWQRGYLGEQIRSMMKNTEEDLKGIGDSGKKNKEIKEEH